MSDPVRFTRAYLERRIQELEAQCAAMREALQAVADDWNAQEDEMVYLQSLVNPRDLVGAALATDAGKAMLEWKESALRALEEWHQARELIGGAQIGDGPVNWAKRVRARAELLEGDRAGAETARDEAFERAKKAETKSAGWKAAMNVHAERAEKAERERDEFEARIDSESAQAQEDRWNQALEEAAKVAEAEPEYPTDWPPEKLSEYAAMIAQGDADVLTFVRAAVGTTKESIATAIRARKTGGA